MASSSRLTLPAIACALSGLLVCVSASALTAQPPTHDVTCAVPAPCEIGACGPSGGWSTTIDYLYWQPRQRGLDFATLENVTQALTLGVGDVHNLEHDRDTGFRVGVTRHTLSGWDIAFRFTQFDTDSRETAVADGPRALFATRGHPDNQLEQATNAEARGAFDYRVFDLETSRNVSMSASHTARLFGGLRWAEIDQRTEFAYDGLDFSNALFTDTTNVSTFGLRAGAEAYWHLTPQWQAFGRFGSTLGWGQVHSRWRETNFGGTQLLVDISDAFDQAIPSLDGTLGLEFNAGWWGLAVGYEIINWFNLSSRSSFPDDFLERTYGPTTHDVLLDGLFARLTVTM